jgi:hypothetical protein
MAVEFSDLVKHCDAETLNYLVCTLQQMGTDEGRTWLRDKSAETLLSNVFTYGLLAITAGGAYYMGKHKERKKHAKGMDTLASGKYEGSEAILTRTDYEPLGDDRFIQRIRGVKGPNGKGTIDLATAGIFHGDVHDVALKIIMEAAKCCTAEDNGKYIENNPVVFDHLHKVKINGQKVTAHQVSEIISQWRQFWGAALTGNAMAGMQLEQGSTGTGEHVIYPVLIYEADDNIRKKQLRIDFIPNWKLRPGALPTPEKVVVETSVDAHSSDPKHPHLDRIRTERAAVRAINGNPLLLEKGWVGIARDADAKAPQRPGSLTSRLEGISGNER